MVATGTRWQRSRVVPCLAPGLLVALLAAAPAAAQTHNEIQVRAYEKKRKEELIATGQRHVDLGWSIKDKGLIPQATYQFVLAVELSEGQHQGAAMVLNIVRQYEEAFWKKRRKKPRKGALQAYEKKAAKLVEEDAKGQVELARAAWKAELVDETKAHLVAAMQFGEVVDIGARGDAKVGRFKVEEELLPWLLEQTIEVGDGERRIDPARLAGAVQGGAVAAGGAQPKLAGLREVASDALVLQSDLDEAAVRDMHALATALWEPLRDRLDGAPTRRLQVIVFDKRSDYDAYLQARGFGDVGSAGFSAYGWLQAMVCAEGLDADSRNALLLHELTHLFFFATSPIAMPDWYAEGFAETFGGQGTFTWDGKQLDAGAKMSDDRLAAIRARPMTLQQVLAGSAIQLLRQDKQEGLRFYTMAWALHRWLSTGEHAWRERFDAWEARLRGTLPGRNSTRGLGSPQAATEAFLAEFKDDLDVMQTAFAEYLRTL